MGVRPGAFHPGARRTHRPSLPHGTRWLPDPACGSACLSSARLSPLPEDRGGAPARRWPEENRYARIRPLAGGLARQRTLITTAVRIVGDSRRFLVLVGGGKPPTAP